MTLAEMKCGQAAVIRKIDGGSGMTRRLEVMGIIPGTHVEKVSDQLMHGPVTVRVGQTQISLGYGIARRILVEMDQA